VTPAEARDGSETDQPLLPRILAGLERPQTLDDLASDLGVTDARLGWHLTRLDGQGHVVFSAETGQWRRTESGSAALESVVVVPSGPFSSRVAADFDQAFAEARLGLFGSAYTQGSGEHRSRLSGEQAVEFTRRLQELIAEYFAPGRGDRDGIKYGLIGPSPPSICTRLTTRNPKDLPDADRRAPARAAARAEADP
jgi:hypothetical protein